MHLHRTLFRGGLAVLVAGLATWGVVAGETPDRNQARRRAAAEIDRLLNAGLDSLGLKPMPKAGDEVFLRRIYLDLAGRIPTAQEAKTFLQSKDSRRREKLIDELLDSPAYVSNMFNFWADLLRVKDRLNTRVSGEPFQDWLKNALAENLPYDQMVHALLTAEGPAYQRGNGATGYFLRDLGMPEDAMANTMRIFAGTRMECAQCHDHPFADWTQRQFFHMTAFLGGMEYRLPQALPGNPRELRQFREEIEQRYGNVGVQVLRRTAQGLSTGLDGSGSGYAKLPDNYAYEDAEPGTWLPASTVMGQKVDFSTAPDPVERRRMERRHRRRPNLPAPPETNSRQAFASWLVSPDHPRFARVIANRLWAYHMGAGLVTPLDDFDQSKSEIHPELLDHLEALVLANNFDLREVQSILLRSKAYQRQAVVDSPLAEDVFAFEGPLMTRLSAEKIWDSLLTLLVPNVDQSLLQGESPEATRLYEEYEKLAFTEAEDFEAAIAMRVEQRQNPEAMREARRQALKARQAKRRELQQQSQQLRRELRQARKQKDQMRIRELQEELLALEEKAEEFRSPAFGRGMVRASELSAPAPPGHFLRTFGQSDREQIESASLEAQIPQALELMNGFLEKNLLKQKRAALHLALQQAGSADEKLETAFLAILARAPSSEERRLWRSEIQRNPDTAMEDLIWVLANCHEFLFRG
ncbi:MAG: DUF1549 domain-containing protein [Planctomycetota bacterium]|nr:MAG: DUF1549 domain-containing protein [Planctomycetota bacterium]